MENNRPVLDYQTFENYFNRAFNKKANELELSKTKALNRVTRRVFDLSVAQSQPLLVNVPFRSLIVSRIYSTASPTTDKSGSVKIIYDTDNLANIENAQNLFVNDTVKSNDMVGQCYFTWTAQADTCIELLFFTDIEVSSGTTKTQIVGSVTVVQPNIKPSSTVTRSAVTATVSYTIPAGKRAMIGASWVTSAAFFASIKVNSVLVAGNLVIGANLVGNTQFECVAGDVIELFSGGASAHASAQIALYDI